MYLVARQKSQAEELIKKLQENAYSATWLPLMETNVTIEALQQLEGRIRSAQLIMITAPAVIDYLTDYLSFINAEHVLITTGKATALRLKVNPSTIILYPNRASGIDAIESEQLLNSYSDRNLLVLGGDSINFKLKLLLKKLHINYSYMSIYSRKNIGIKNLEVVEKLISKPEIVGIIITSKQIARYLIECIDLLQIRHEVQQFLIISIHSQITDYLHCNGFVNIMQTESSDNNSILKLIRNIADE